LSASHAWRKFTFQNDRKLTLAGLIYTGSEPGTVVVVCHGFTGSKEGGGRALTMAEELGRLGYSTFLFDFSGCGESEGHFSDISLSNHINDVKCAVDFCHAFGFKSIITMGRSFGGAAVLCHGGTEKKVAGVSSWSAPADPSNHFSGYLNGTAPHERDLVPLTGQGGAVFVKKSFFDDLSRHDVIDRVSLLSPRPLLVVHGEDDSVVPLAAAKIILAAAGEPKALKIIPGADHQYTGHYQEVWKTFFSWLRSHFPV
jgi:putative redox protein